MDMVAKEKDIADDDHYLEKYYDQYYSILNNGDMTLVAPRYAHLFHGILYQITMSLNMKKMLEEKNKWMAMARERIEGNLHLWATKLQILAEGVHMVNPEKACHELLTEIVRKIFNSKGNAVLKRYYAMFLARGGRQSSRSSLRESRKQEGLARKKKRKAEKGEDPS
jgi:hypothetical protein